MCSRVGQSIWSLTPQSLPQKRPQSLNPCAKTDDRRCQKPSENKGKKQKGGGGGGIGPIPLPLPLTGSHRCTVDCPKELKEIPRKTKKAGVTEWLARPVDESVTIWVSSWNMSIRTLDRGPVRANNAHYRFLFVKRTEHGPCRPIRAVL